MKLGIGFPAGREPAAALADAVDSESALAALPKTVMVTGIQHLPDTHWVSLVRILVAMSKKSRIILFTARGDRASGHICRTPEFSRIDDPTHHLGGHLEKHTKPLERMIRTAWTVVRPPLRDANAQEYYVNTAVEDIRGSLKDPQPVNLTPSRGPAPAPDDEDYRSLRRDLVESIERYSEQNTSLARLLAHTLYYVCLPTILKEENIVAGVPGNDNAIVRALNEDLAALSLPPSLVGFPARAMERVAMFVLGEFEAREQEALRNLAQSADPLTPRLLDSALPGLSQNVIRRHSALRVAFKFDRWLMQDLKGDISLYPEFYRVLKGTRNDNRIRKVHRDVVRRRLLLRRYRQWCDRKDAQDGGPRQGELGRIIHSFLQLDLESVNLLSGPFAELVEGVVSPLYQLLGATGQRQELGLIVRLISEREGLATNLNPLVYSKLMYLYGQARVVSAGDKRTLGERAVARLRRAYWVANHARAAKEDWSYWGELLPKADVHPVSLGVESVGALTLQGWQSGRLAIDGCWRTLLGLQVPGSSADLSWGGSGRGNWRELEKGLWQRRLDPLTRALTLRTLAIEKLVDEIRHDPAMSNVRDCSDVTRREAARLLKEASHCLGDEIQERPYMVDQLRERLAVEADFVEGVPNSDHLTDRVEKIRDFLAWWEPSKQDCPPEIREGLERCGEYEFAAIAAELGGS